MEVREVNNDIQRLRKMKGISRVWKSNPISEVILGIEYENFPGLWTEFLESRPQSTEYGEWIEHKWLLRGLKGMDLSLLLKNLSKLIGDLSRLKIWNEVTYCSIEDMDSVSPSHYYFLIGIISNGKDSIKEEID